MNRLRRINSLVVFLQLLLLISVLGLVANNVLFTHVHQLPSGELITHAHPFQQSTDNSNTPKGHDHTNVEILFLKTLLLLFLSPIGYWLVKLQGFVGQLATIVHIPKYFNLPLRITARAPPAYS